MKKNICSIIPIFYCLAVSVAQDVDSLNLSGSDNYWIQQTELVDRMNDGEADHEEEITESKKIDINTCKEDDLIRFGLTRDQVDYFISYRSQMKGITDLYELQAVPGLDDFSIKILRMHTKVKHEISFKQLMKDLSGGNTSLILRTDFYKSNGVDYTKYLPEFSTSFMQSFRTRIKYVYTGSLLDFSMVGEKDAGEAFSWSRTRKGMDAYMGGIRFRGNGVIRQLILGDYKVMMGQGLIIWQGFGGGIGMNGMTGRPKNEIFSPHRSYNEFYFKRGIAAELQWRNWQAGVFLSKRGLDASLQWDSTEQVQKIRAIYTTGMHSDSLSNIRAKTVTEYILGGKLILNTSYGYFGLTSVGYDYGKSFYRNPELYAFHYQNKKRKYYSSADYSFSISNFHFFGELAVMNARAIAIQQNVSVVLNKSMDIVLGYRNFGPAYRSSDAVFAGLQTNPSNESGWSFQGRYGFDRGSEITILWDLSSLRWIRYGECQPLHSSNFILSFRKFDKLGNGLAFKYRHMVSSSSDSLTWLYNSAGDEIASIYDFHTRVKIGQGKCLFFRYLFRKAKGKDNVSNAGLLCWGLDVKCQRGFTFQWRFYLTEGSASAGGINFHEADLGSTNQSGWLYGNKKAVSIMANKNIANKIKLGLKGQFNTDKGIESILKNTQNSTIISAQFGLFF